MNDEERSSTKPCISTTATLLLAQVSTGDEQAAESLFPLIYDQLRVIAGQQFRGEAASHTLQPTALVHETFMNLIQNDGRWKNRSHFCAIAASAMRKILINHARALPIPFNLLQGNNVCALQGLRNALEIDFTITAQTVANVVSY